MNYLKTNNNEYQQDTQKKSLLPDYEFLDRWVRNASAEHLRLYIYILCQYRKEQAVPDLNAIANALNISPKDAKTALEFWTAVGVLETDHNNKYTLKLTNSEPEPSLRNTQKQNPPAVPQYSNDDILDAKSQDDKLDYLFKHTQLQLGKTLTSTDIHILYSFYDYYGFAVEVAAMLITHAVNTGKKTMRQIERMAIEWAENEIYTTEEAENFIKLSESIRSKEMKIRNMLLIQDRQTTETERRYIKSWIVELKMSYELISNAFERTVKSTGKLSFAYMDKILRSWHNSGIKTINQLLAADEAYKEKKAKTDKSSKPTKFSNFSNTRTPDNSEIEKRALEKLMNK